MQRKLILIGLLFFATLANAQMFTMNGYVKDMHIMYNLSKEIPISATETMKNTQYNIVHNRLNFRLYPAKNLTVALEVRNRLFTGKFIRLMPDYGEQVAMDDGLVDLSWNTMETDNYFLNTTIDRFYLDYTIGKWQARLGRQRINWGMSLIWNPNDIFNAYSFFDFDYEERPGSDAALFTWYPSTSSTIELAYKADTSTNQQVVAAKYRLNVGTYDFQAIAGWAGTDYVVGGGWSGGIGDLAFRGEASYFIPTEEFKSIASEVLAASVGLDYSFANSLYLGVSYLYNGSGTTGQADENIFLNPNFSLSAKRLSVGKHEVFAQASYPFIPILTGAVSTMINTNDKSFFVGPSLTLSAQDNLEVMLTGQLLFGDEGSEYGFAGNMQLIFARVRWSF